MEVNFLKHALNKQTVCFLIHLVRGCMLKVCFFSLWSLVKLRERKVINLNCRSIIAENIISIFFSRFRCMEPYGPYKPVMGVHTAVETEGEIKVGDPVYVIRK